MAPRFAGGQDDWLDDVEASLRPKAANKQVRDRAKTLPPEEGNGTVTEIYPNQSAVRLDETSRTLLCRYRLSAFASGLGRRERSPVCVADRVRVEAGVIVGRCERRNRLIRSAPGARDPLLHVLAANLDLLVIVAAAHQPEFSGGIVDRFLVAASDQRIPQVLCVNKADLIEPGEALPWSHYPAAGVCVVEASARDGRGADRLAALLRGKTAAFCGHSGVGKTSLLRRLLSDQDRGRVTAVSETSGKGRHTTSGAVLARGPEGSSLIDTPGIMDFGLIEIAPDELLRHFPELLAAATGCAKGCAHREEPACRLRLLPRHASYRAIRGSLAAAPPPGREP